jgi:transcriptional regulator with GAF, ATPase, and Fis domain
MENLTAATDASVGQELDSSALAGRLSNLARELQRGVVLEDVLETIVHAAVELVPGTVNGSISVVMARKTVQSRAASGDLPRCIDALQNETGEGPSLDAAFRQRVVHVPDMSVEDRWPAFAPRAAGAGAHSMLAFQLFVQDHNLGALNLYGAGPNAFTEESLQIGHLIAAHAAVAFAGKQHIEQLYESVESRDLIGQAKGILMERFKITGPEAFLILTKASSRANIKLHDIALHLATSGEIIGENKSGN